MKLNNNMDTQSLINLITCTLMFVVAGTAYYFGYMRRKHEEETKNKPKLNSDPTPKSHWNYRVATRLLKHPLREEMWREFLIISCYYTNGKPDGYSDKVKMDAFEDWEDLESTNKLIAKAFEKEILNLDDFPNVYKFLNLDNAPNV